MAGPEIVAVRRDHQLAIRSAGGGGDQLDLGEFGGGAVEREPCESEGMRFDRDHFSACADMARHCQRVGPYISAYIDEHAALRRMRAQEVQLFNIVLGIEERAAFGRARLMKQSK